VAAAIKPLRGSVGNVVERFGICGVFRCGGGRLGFDSFKNLSDFALKVLLVCRLILISGLQDSI
jgi:hypothetical protein